MLHDLFRKPVPTLRDHALAILLLGALLVGLACIALLPPFEGFDETAHYSAIQQFAETGRWPRYGDKLSRAIDDYLAVAPAAEAAQGGWTYRSFFEARGAIAIARQAVHARPDEPRHYTPGTSGNWQAQHPPLYYALLAPAYLVSKDWSLANQLLLLRTLSYLLAWGALAITAWVALRTFRDERLATLLPLGAALWPALFPAWFPEMARLGNDSLVTLVAALTLILLYRAAASPTWRDHALLGGTLGLGLLTKATFLPVAAAVFVTLAVLTIRARSADPGSHRVARLCVAGVIMLAIASPWYAARAFGTGTAIGSDIEIKMRAGGGLISGLAQHLDAHTLLWAPWDFAVSFLWSGTWSFLIPPRVTMLPLLALAAGLACGCTRVLRRHPLAPIDWFALSSLALFIMALGYYSIVQLSLLGAVTTAWYLHALAPILALLVGYGIAGGTHAPWLRRSMGALVVYALGFLAVMTMLNALYFAGCGPKLPGRMYFAWSTGIECLANAPRLYDNLAALAFPGPAIALFVAGWLLLLGGAVVALARYTSLTSTR